MSSFYDYIQHKRHSIWDNKSKTKKFNKLLKNQDFVESIRLSLALFKVVFKNDDKFTKKGVLLLIKIYQPLILLSNNSGVCEYIYKLDKQFLYDTKINPSEFYQVQINPINLEEKVYIYKDFFDKNRNIFQMFEDLWPKNDDQGF